MMVARSTCESRSSVTAVPTGIRDPRHAAAGLSLTGSLSSPSTSKYPLIADQGSNDGLTPLVDIIAPNSLTLVATGSVPLGGRHA